MVYLATDPDREGEAIAWHLQQALDLPDDRVRRVTFHEITERAVKEAFSHSGPINMDMVNAQQARRFLDRFVGYQLSPLLWKKVGARNLSAGRVQSVAVRLIADRERDIRAFVTEEYWKIAATVSPAGSTAVTDQFKASLAEYDGAKFEAKTEAEAHAVRDALQSVPYSVAKVDETEKLDKADAPFKTSTLQQQAAIRLRFSGKRTMKVAQELYEGIDVDGCGPGRLDHLHAYRQPPGLGRGDDRRPREDQERVRRSLLARQADPLRRRQEWPRRPTRPFAPPTSRFTPDRIKGTLTHDQFRLYQLIYARFVASQMAPAVFMVTDVSVAAGAGHIQGSG